ncbi:zinc-dependent metalloprotease family protein [Rothia dentocariosa]|uniref:zinc-dependent metalloprotease family protein n=1 Tax=Rothia dentocariosa TaxID=2047 RepID=UPI00244C8DFC|nr:zinc-dependent metalloprotease family protein [Rothia dentocariosa]
MKLRTIVRLMLAFVSLVLVAPLNSLPVSAVEAKPAQPAPAQNQNIDPVQSPNSGDRDGDHIPDELERDGYDINNDGIPEIDFPKMGADPNHKDIFVEMDYMPGELASEEELDRIVQSFADINISNPDGRTGINLHLDAGAARGPKYNLGGGEQVKWQVLSDDIGNNAGNWARFKASHFNQRRDGLFHYMVWGDYYVQQQNGESGSSGLGQLGGRDFMVTVGKTHWNNNKGNMSDIRVGTFIHELGHNLGLQHGGDADEKGEKGKPQYFSVMNYNYQLTGVPKADGTKYFGYLQQDMPTLKEWALDERKGFGPQARGYMYRPNSEAVLRPADGPVDLNGNGEIDHGIYALDLNRDGMKGWLTAPSDLKKLSFGAVFGRGADETIPEPKVEINPITADDARELDLIS